MTRAAAPGSRREKANTSGPLKLSRMHSKSVPCTARLANVFLTTFTYTSALRAATRSAVISATVKPRYSAATAAWADAATVLTSSTRAFLASMLSGIHIPPGIDDTTPQAVPPLADSLTVRLTRQSQVREHHLRRMRPRH